jgi:hypothetical protein
VEVMGQVGCIYMNFGLWAIALVPGWLVVRQFGLHSDDKKVDREKRRFNVVDVGRAGVRPFKEDAV